jgi:hypothetical protein
MSTEPTPPQDPTDNRQDKHTSDARKHYPYQPNRTIAAVLLIAGVLVILGTGGATTLFGAKLGFTAGDAAASAGILFVLALVMVAPALMMDDGTDAGGEPSTMRILSLAIVLTFCILMLKTGWDKQALPSLENQGNWVWLVTAALGGKALQRFAEIRDQSKNTGDQDAKK